MNEEGTIIRNPIDKYFEKITYYHKVFFALMFLSLLPNFWHLLSIFFVSPPMDFYCNSTTMSNSLKNKCPCSDPHWDTRIFTKTMQTKYSIYCDTEWLVSFSESMLYFGTLIGASLFGFLSDIYGRLSMFSFSCYILATSGCLVVIMPSISSFIFMRCMEGLGAGGVVVTAYVLCIEYSGVHYREIISAVIHIPIILSHITLPGISYMLRDCNQFQLAISIPVYIYATFGWIFLESPKWLMDSDHIDEAALVLKKIAKFNKQPTRDIKAEILEYNESQNTARATEKLKFSHIFKDGHLTCSFVCLSWIYFVCGLGYYGQSQFISQMTVHTHRDVAIAGSFLLPGAIIAIFLIKKLYRRTFLMMSCFLSGMFMIVAVSINPSFIWVRMIMVCICNCCIFFSFLIAYLYGVELFPTSIRSSALGILYLVSRLGQIAAPPIVNSLSEVYSGSVFAVTAILASIACFPLPETKGKELPSNLQDSKNLPFRKSMLERSIKSVLEKQSVPSPE